VTGGTTTLSGQTVKVSGAARLTINARYGRRVGLAVSPAPEGLFSQIYVVPHSSKKVGFAALGSWTDLSGTTDSYAVLNQTTGVPVDTSRTFARSGPATMVGPLRRAGQGWGPGALLPSIVNGRLAYDMKRRF
jgi:hypothetical protein